MLFKDVVEVGKTWKVREWQPLPLHDMLFIEGTLAPDRTKGGLFIPDVAKAQSWEGRVLFAGKEAVAREPDIVGKLVVLHKHHGSVEVRGAKLYITARLEHVIHIIVERIRDETPGEKAERTGAREQLAQEQLNRERAANAARSFDAANAAEE